MSEMQSINNLSWIYVLRVAVCKANVTPVPKVQLRSFLYTVAESRKYDISKWHVEFPWSMLSLFYFNVNIFSFIVLIFHFNKY